jgi:hypothetical protein
MAYETMTEFSPLHYTEQEADPFIGGAFRRLKRLARGPLGAALKRLAPIAARAVVGAIPGVGAVAGPLAGRLVASLTREQQEQLEAGLNEIVHGELGQEISEQLGETYGTGEYGEVLEGESVQGIGEIQEGELEEAQELGSLHEGEAYELGGFGEVSEWESEGNQEHLEHPESEFGMAHSEAIHHEAALMEQIAHEAATTQNEVAAEALVGSLVPLAMRAVRSAPAVARATPVLTRAASRLAYGLRRSPATRQLVRVVPQILARTARVLAASAARGRPIPLRQAARVMARQTYRTFDTPEIPIRILVRSRRLRRRYAA